MWDLGARAPAAAVSWGGLALPGGRSGKVREAGAKPVHPLAQVPAVGRPAGAVYLLKACLGEKIARPLHEAGHHCEIRPPLRERCRNPPSPIAVAHIPDDAQNGMVGHGFERADQLPKELRPGQDSGPEVGRDLPGHGEQHVRVLAEILG